MKRYAWLVIGLCAWALSLYVAHKNGVRVGINTQPVYVKWLDENEQGRIVGFGSGEVCGPVEEHPGFDWYCENGTPVLHMKQP